MTMHDDDGLDALFAAARDDRPSGALVARVLADAEAARPGVRPGIFAALFRGLGGWPAAAGLAAACAVGLTVGYIAPEALPLSAAAAPYDLIDLAPGWPVLADLGG